MTQGQVYADAFAERASQALAGCKTRTEVYSIGSLAFRLIGPLDEPVNWLGRAFLAGLKATKQVKLHDLYAWDGRGEDRTPPLPTWKFAETLPLGIVKSHTSDAIRCAVDVHTQSVIVSNFARGRSDVWYQDIPALPFWAKASPFRIPLSWLCNRHGMQVLHGAAVGLDGRAVLLAGNGGAGKSTTALACALAGFDYLGDDYCAVEPSAGKVHMLYRTAKMFTTTLELLPSMRARVENHDPTDADKGVTFLEASDFALRPSADLCAILLPRVGISESMLYPATRQEALNALLPSTIAGLMGGTAVTPRMLMELVRSVPSYHLILRPDMQAVVDAVASCLAGPKCQGH